MSKLELDDNRRIPNNIHVEHHEFIHSLKTKQEIREEEVKKIKTSLITGAIFSFFTTLAGVIWYAIQHYVASGGK